MPEQIFELDISRQELLRYYAGEAQTLVVTTKDMLTLSLPVHLFRPYVSTHGLQGKFLVIYDDNNKLVALKKLSPS